MKTTLVIMAAWMGSRYGGLKQIDGFGPHDETILEYSVYDAIRAWFTDVVLIIRESFYEQFKEVLGNRFDDKIRVQYVFQEINPSIEWFEDIQHREKPRGTGHAVLAARDVVDSNFCVINADDYYGVDAYRQMFDWLSNKCKEDSCSMVGYILKNTLSDHGTVNRWICEVDDTWQLVNVQEWLKLWRDSATTVINPNGDSLPDTSIVSMNFWWFHQSFFNYLEDEFHKFLTVHGQDEWYEFYIPSAANNFSQNKANSCDVMISEDSWYGVTYAKDKETTQQAITKLVNEWIYPDHLWEKIPNSLL